MPSLTLVNLRQGLVRSGLGRLEEFATTTDLTTSAVVVSTNLRNLGYTENDMVQARWPWLYIRGTNNSQVDREPDDYTGSSGTITVRGETLAADSGAVTCELLPFRGGRLNDALNKARFEIVDRLNLLREYDTITSGTGFGRLVLPSGLFVGDPTEILIGDLPNPNMSENVLKDNDDAQFNTVDNWTSANATTWSTRAKSTDVDQDYIILPPGETAGFLLTAGNSDACTVLYNLIASGRASGTFLRGLQLNFFIWLYTRTAGRLSARISMDAAATDGATHSGNGWELLRTSATVTANPGDVSVGFVDSTNTSSIVAFVDNAIAIAGPAERAEAALNRMANWRSIKPFSTDTDGFIDFQWRLPSFQWLKIRGRDYLSSVSAETDTMEIDDAEAELLYAYARKEIWEQEMGMWDTDDQKYRKAVDGFNKAELDIERVVGTLGRRKTTSPVRPGMLSWI